MVQVESTRVRTPRPSDAVKAPDCGAFLRVDYVPIELWHAMTQRQRDLHLLWTKKLLPVYTDTERVRNCDLFDGDRQVAVWLLRKLAARAIPLRGPFTEVDESSERVHFYAHVLLAEGKTTLGVSINLSGPDGPGPIVIHLHNLSREIDILILWCPKDDPWRGTVSLVPQAFSSTRRFSIAAFNQHQFAGICRALAEYCASSGDTSLPGTVTRQRKSRGPLETYRRTETSQWSR